LFTACGLPDILTNRGVAEMPQPRARRRPAIS
jgi:hypothetical protein